MRKLLLTAIILLIGTSIFAQQATINNVLSIKSAKKSGRIYDDNTLVGYYVFYVKEKADKKNTAYEIDLFDNNYNASGAFEIVRPTSTYMLEMVYNSEVFMIHFYDVNVGYEFVTYDKTGKKLGSKTYGIKEISKYDLTRTKTNLKLNSDNVTIYKTGNQGFVRATFMKNDKMGYEIVGYDNTAKEKWTYGSNVNSTLVETVEINDVTENYLIATVSKKKTLMAKAFDNFCVVLDVKTGKLIKEFQLGSEATGQLSVLKSYLNPNSKKINIIGEYYKPKDDIIKDKSIGLYFQELELNGEIISTNKFAWKGEIDKFKQANLDEEDKKADSRNFSIFFHDVIVTKDGGTQLIGEQFIKQFSAGGTALNMLGGGGPPQIEILVTNMVVIEFDKANKLVDYQIIPKKKSRVYLDYGYATVSSTLLGYYMNYLGAFDYTFTSSDKSKDQYDIVYVDANKKEEKGAKKADIMLGVISINNGERTTKRVPINSTGDCWFSPAKTGFISISEYFKKEKKLTFRLEPIKY